jgi:surfeit locus 1 family protein
MLIATLVICVTCVRLGIWQLHRLHEVRAYNSAVEAGMADPPSALNELVPIGSPTPPVSQLQYRHVVATGTYDTSQELILYGRALNETPGNHVLTPLVMPDGRAVIVDRGWVPYSMGTPPVAAAAPPSGSVQVTGVLEPSDPPGAGPKTGPVKIVTTVDIPRISPQLPYPVLPVFLRLSSQDPAQSGALPTPVPPPPLTEGPHESYMIQWFTFAVIFFGGFVLLVWREARGRQPAHIEA